MNVCYLSAILLVCLSASGSGTEAGDVTRGARRGFGSLIGGTTKTGGSITGSLGGATGGLIQGVESAVGGVTNTAGTALNGVGGAAGSAVDDLEEKVQKIIDDQLGVDEKNITESASFVADVGSEVEAGAGGIVSEVKNILGVLQELGCTDLIDLIKEVGLEQVLNGDVVVTLIAIPNAVLSRIVDLVKADIAFKLALVKSLIIVGKYTVEQLAEIATKVTHGLANSLLTLSGTELIVHPYVDELVVQGGAIIQGNLDAGKCIVHVVNNILVPSSLTIEEFLKTSGGVLGQLFKLVSACPAIKSLLSDATQSLTLITPTIDFIYSLLVDVALGNIARVLSRLSTIIFPSLFCWEDLLNLVGQSIVDIGGNLQLVSLINATTIKIGANIVLKSAFGIAFKNGILL